MSNLSVFVTSNPHLPMKILNHDEDIISTLEGTGLVYKTVPVPADLLPGLELDEVESAAGVWLDQWLAANGYSQRQVISANRRFETIEALRKPYLAEQQLAGRSAWLMLGGFALLSVHVGDAVYQIRLEKGALLELPAGALYWFDIGLEPHVLALHAGEQSLAAELSGAGLAQAFPELDD